MTRKLIPMAIAYDFDGTLAPGNIQENSFIPAIGMKKAAFWQKNKARAEKHEADEVLSYMTYTAPHTLSAHWVSREPPCPNTMHWETSSSKSKLERSYSMRGQNSLMTGPLNLLFHSREKSNAS